MATKKTTKKPSASSKAKAQSKKQPAKKSLGQSQAQRQRTAVIIMAGALLLFCMTLIKGESAWAAIHNFIFGVFGICAYFWPIMLVYLAVMFAINKPMKSTVYNIVGVGVFIAFLSGIIHVAWDNIDAGDLGEQIVYVWDMRTQVTAKSGGVLGALVGGGFDLLAGKAGALILLIVIDILIIMLITGTTLGRAYNLFSKPVKKVGSFTEEKIEQGMERHRERKENGEGFTIPSVKKKFKPIDIGPEATPEMGKDPEPETIFVEELAGNFEKEKAQENIDNIIKGMPDFKEPEGDVAVAEVKPAEIIPITKPKKQKAEKPVAEPEIVEDEPKEEAPAPVKEYKKPPLDCISLADNSGVLNYEQELKANSVKLEETLESFGVRTKLVGICRGPSVTRYELQPAPGVKISRITGLSDDIALALASSGVRIEAPIPNKSAVGIEVPNKSRATVSLREIIETAQYDTQVSKSKLSVALGKDITGETIIADLAKMPHLLIAGTTGSGKSVCLNAMIISLLYNATPDEVKLLMIDPKQVEFTVYNGIPHLLVPVVSDPRKAAGALGWAVTEMLKRYKMFSEKNVRDIKGYNRLARADGSIPPMPQIVIFIDELSDLMMAAPTEVEDSICRLAQMARAAGMHLVIATQRPSVNVITGIIKANIPSRIALSVSSQVDSRTIIDASGAEKLLGNGDMLFNPVGTSKPIRVQGCFLSDGEVENVVNFIKEQESSSYDDQVMEEIERQAVMEKKKSSAAADDDGDDGSEGGDEMLPKAIEVVVENQMASTTLLQRKLKLGYARAARLMDALEEKGIVGPFEGSKPRKVLISKQQWMEMNALANASPAREKPYGEEDDYSEE
ncbi:MAG: DNA translocase FtsK 4TM domain-containing protein [Clostridia bacterium]|nr:DNA translocase FtsK 4TM domain-containing protein [Clostridia bacterium]